jgi:hypothetical protein
MDGISSMGFHLAMDDTYDITKLIPIRKVSFIQRMILRASFLLYISKLIYISMTEKIDKNPLHDGKRELTGIKKVASEGDIKFFDVKNAAKGLKLTINDMMMSCLSTTIK